MGGKCAGHMPGWKGRALGSCGVCVTVLQHNGMHLSKLTGLHQATP